MKLTFYFKCFYRRCVLNLSEILDWNWFIGFLISPIRFQFPAIPLTVLLKIGERGGDFTVEKWRCRDFRKNLSRVLKYAFDYTLLTKKVLWNLSKWLRKMLENPTKCPLHRSFTLYFRANFEQIWVQYWN